MLSFIENYNSFVRWIYIENVNFKLDFIILLIIGICDTVWPMIFKDLPVSTPHLQGLHSGSLSTVPTFYFISTKMIFMQGIQILLRQKHTFKAVCSFLKTSTLRDFIVLLLLSLLIFILVSVFWERISLCAALTVLELSLQTTMDRKS